MDVMSYSEVRNNLKSVMDRVVDDCSEVIVTRRGGKPVVLISLDTWRSLEETEYLLSDPANAADSSSAGDRAPLWGWRDRRVDHRGHL